MVGRVKSIVLIKTHLLTLRSQSESHAKDAGFRKLFPPQAKMVNLYTVNDDMKKFHVNIYFLYITEFQSVKLHKLIYGLISPSTER